MRCLTGAAPIARIYDVGAAAGRKPRPFPVPPTLAGAFLPVTDGSASLYCEAARDGEEQILFSLLMSLPQP